MPDERKFEALNYKLEFFEKNLQDLENRIKDGREYDEVGNRLEYNPDKWHVNQQVQSQTQPDQQQDFTAVKDRLRKKYYGK